MTQKKSRDDVARLRAELLDILWKVGELDPVHGGAELGKLQQRYRSVRDQLQKLEAERSSK